MGTWFDSLSPEDQAKHLEEVKEQSAYVAELRRNGVTDSLRVDIGTIKGWEPSRENSLAITKIEEAIMWLEKVVDRPPQGC